MTTSSAVMSAPWFVPGLIVFVMIVFLEVIAYAMPRLTRPDLYFAVTVPPGFRDSTEGRGILRRYRVGVVIYGIIAIAVALAGFWISRTPDRALVVAGLVLQPLGGFLAYYGARRRVWPHAVAPATAREAALTPRASRLPGGWVAQSGPFAVLAAAAVWLGLHWRAIPDRFAVHWGMDGQPDRWATRSFGGVFLPLIFAACLCALFGFLAYAILHWSRAIRTDGVAGQSERHFRRMVVAILVAMEYFVALQFAWVGMRAFSPAQTEPKTFLPLLILAIGFSVAVTYLLIRAGQGGTRLVHATSPEGGTAVGDRTADRYWKLGLFYVKWG